MRAKSFSLLIAAALGLAPACALAQDLPQDPGDIGGESATVAASDDPDAARTDQAKVPLDEIRRYVMVYNAVKQAYVDPVDDKQLMQSAVRGLLLDLDPHSAYLDRDQSESFDEATSGAYDGVGVELQQQGDTLKVIAPIDGGPAERAGILAGDAIVAIDGKPKGDAENEAKPIDVKSLLP